VLNLFSLRFCCHPPYSPTLLSGMFYRTSLVLLGRQTGSAWEGIFGLTHASACYNCRCACNTFLLPDVPFSLALITFSCFSPPLLSPPVTSVLARWDARRWHRCHSYVTTYPKTLFLCTSRLTASRMFRCCLKTCLVIDAVKVRTISLHCTYPPPSPADAITEGHYLPVGVCLPYTYVSAHTTERRVICVAYRATYAGGVPTMCLSSACLL